uniref:Multiprotein bridging factor 1 N-terminal domain-containing protein n=1 Tax=Callithrix jacchus TaxID=9483 RepID=A0A8I3W915_CALJA
MAESYWDTVTVLRTKGPTAAQARSKQAILAAQRRGEDAETSKRWAAGQNKQHSITKNTAKLDRETEELHHDRVTLEVGKVIQQGRQSKGLTQKDLAMKINEKPQEWKLCAHPRLEIYQQDQIHFMCPLARQGDFYVPEAKETEQKWRGLAEAIDAQVDGTGTEGGV